MLKGPWFSNWTRNLLTVLMKHNYLIKCHSRFCGLHLVRWQFIVDKFVQEKHIFMEHWWLRKIKEGQLALEYFHVIDSGSYWEGFGHSCLGQHNLNTLYYFFKNSCGVVDWCLALLFSQQESWVCFILFSTVCCHSPKTCRFCLGQFGDYKLSL